MILLDTSALIDLLANKDKAVKVLTRYKNDPLSISVITWAELQIGFLYFTSKKQEKARKKLEELIEGGILEILDITRPVALQYASLQTVLLKIGKPIASFDGLIAATALSYNYTLITSDASFKRIPKLKSIFLL